MCVCKCVCVCVMCIVRDRDTHREREGGREKMRELLDRNYFCAHAEATR